MLREDVRRDLSDTLDLEPHRRRIWGLCYRLTGVAADADDLVQETFLRALSSPPADRSADVGPWLARVATNASLDLLRKRKRAEYLGSWLPSPVESERLIDSLPAVSARYSQLESASYAFLLALEALTPIQRAVLILRDVWDYSVSEAASALDISEANVKTSHHRARAALASYDETAAALDAATRERARGAMMRLLAVVATSQQELVETLLSRDVVSPHDSGGAYRAAGRPVVGPRRLARFLVKVGGHLSVRGARGTELNGLAALVLETRSKLDGAPPRTVSLFVCDERALITRIYSVVAPRKLTHVRF